MQDDRGTQFLRIILSVIFVKSVLIPPAFWFIFLESLNELPEDEVKATTSKCKCQSWDTCQWSKDMVKSISSLPSNHPTKKDYELFFRLYTCSNNEEKVYCCDEKDLPTLVQRQLLKQKPRKSPFRSPFRSSLNDIEVKNCLLMWWFLNFFKNIKI